MTDICIMPGNNMPTMSMLFPTSWYWFIYASNASFLVWPSGTLMKSLIHLPLSKHTIIWIFIIRLPCIWTLLNNIEQKNCTSGELFFRGEVNMNLAEKRHQLYHIFCYSVTNYCILTRTTHKPHQQHKLLSRPPINYIVTAAQGLNWIAVRLILLSSIITQPSYQNF